MSRKRGRWKSGVLALHFVYGKNVPSAFPSLALIGTVQERDDLCAGAAIVWPEQAITDAVGDAVLHGPRHRVGVIGAGGHIAERACLNFREKGSNGSDEHSVVGRQISHCNGLRMSCCISRNRNIEIENLAIICADFDSISTRFQINRVFYCLTVYLNDYIRQLGRCCLLYTSDAADEL